MSWAGRIATLLALALLPACQGGSSSGGDDDTDTWSGPDSDTDVDTDSDTAPLVPAECPPALVPDCEDTIYELPLFFAAEQIGPGYQMVDACSAALLAEREIEDEVEIAVYARDSWSDYFGEDPNVATLVTGAGHARGIAGPLYDSDEDVRYLVLVCDEAGACVVHRVIDVSGEPLEIEPEPAWSLPAAYAMRAMSWAEGLATVVVGNGAVAVWGDGDVYGLVPADTGAPFDDASRYERFVGGGGRLARNNGSEWSYSELDSGTSADLLAADDWDDGLIVAAADGTLGSGEDPPLDWLPAATEAIVEVAANEWGSEYHAITESGCVLAREYYGGEDGPCVYGVMPEPGARVFYWHCWDVYNVSFLAPGGLYGYWDCIHIN